MTTKDPLATAIVQREAEARSDRSDVEPNWELITKYTIPRKSIFYEESTQGHRKDRYVLDSTAPRSLELFASFLHSSLNNPAQQWIQTTLEEGMTVSLAEKQWFESAQAKLQMLLTTSTNIYTALHENYLDLGSIGTACLLTEKTSDNGLRVDSYHMKSIVAEEGADGTFDVFFRTQKWNKRQATQRFPGKDLGPTFMKMATRRNGTATSKKGDFIHAVFPITDEDLVSKIPPKELRRLKAKKTTIVGVWINKADEVILEVGGFRSQPYSVPRWYKVQGEPYGRSPAMTVLGDILMVNRISETVLKGAEKLVDPPLVIPEGGIVSPVRLFPGGITYSDGPIDIKPLIPPGASRIEMGTGLMEQRQKAIREGFFVPLFITPESPVKTATQILQETDERNRAVGPMLIRLHNEHFNRFIPRAFRLLDEMGVFGPKPDTLADKIKTGLRITYLSPITNSVAQNEGLSTLRLFEGIAPWAQVDEGAFDSIDIDEAVRIVHKASGAPLSMRRSKANIDSVRKARSEQQQAQQTQENTIAAVEAGAKLQAANR